MMFFRSGKTFFIMYMHSGDIVAWDLPSITRRCASRAGPPSSRPSPPSSAPSTGPAR